MNSMLKLNGDNFLKFKKLLKFVFENEHSDFYRIKFQKAGFNPLLDFNSIDDVKKIPFLTREELSSADPLKLLFVNEEEINSIFATSGTTGKPFLTFCSQSRVVPDALKDVNIDRRLILTNPLLASSLYSYFRKNKFTWILVGDIHNIPASLAIASRLGVNNIYTTPTLAIILKEYLKSYPDLEKSLKFLEIGGEVVSPAKKKLLKEFYPGLEIFIDYASSEVRLAAFQCHYLTKREDQVYYHPIVSGCYFEVINPDTEEELGFGKKGELIITDFRNSATPIIRYKIGDMASFEKNDCPCGSSGPFLQIWGRINYDMVKAGGFELRVDMIEKPIMNLSEHLKDSFEIHIYENFVGTEPRIKVALNLSFKEGIKESPELKEIIKNEFLENWRLSPKLNLKKAVEAGLFYPLQIDFVEFPDSPKTKRRLILH